MFNFTRKTDHISHLTFAFVHVCVCSCLCNQQGTAYASFVKRVSTSVVEKNDDGRIECVNLLLNCVSVVLGVDSEVCVNNQIRLDQFEASWCRHLSVTYRIYFSLYWLCYLI